MLDDILVLIFLSLNESLEVLDQLILLVLKGRFERVDFFFVLLLSDVPLLLQLFD